MERITASIITIGDELLIGQVVDTNSAWIAQQLNKAGVYVTRRIAVGDVWNDIVHALDEEINNSNIVLMTGGLGPTSDDITKPLLCAYFGGKLVIDEMALENVKTIFQKYLSRPLLNANLKQAEVPDVCTVIQNKTGTAPGMMFFKNDAIIISMPGVPHEMMAMMESDVLPLIKEKFILGGIYHKTLLTAGIGESFLAEMLVQFEAELPTNIKLAYLPNHGMVRLRLTGTTDILQSMEEKFTKLKNIVESYLVADEDISMQQVLGNLLKRKEKTVSTAESCTGGYIAQLITSIPGASNYFQGSIVSYSNQVKINQLGVSGQTLNVAGAVSAETVSEMAYGILKTMQTDYAIAVSGIMGPGGGTPEKPTGTVWVAVGKNGNMITKKFHFRFTRQRNIELTAINALNMLREFILKDD